jgi:hypothetical protein
MHDQGPKWFRVEPCERKNREGQPAERKGPSIAVGIRATYRPEHGLDEKNAEREMTAAAPVREREAGRPCSAARGE